MPGFEEWAVVELFGHQKIAGKVTEANIAGGSMLRVDVPDVGDRPGFTKIYGAGAIYAITPCSEDVARRAAAYLRTEPIRQYELAPALPPAPHETETCGHCGKQAEIGVISNGVPLCDPCWSAALKEARENQEDDEGIDEPEDDGLDGKTCSCCTTPAARIVDGVPLCDVCELETNAAGGEGGAASKACERCGQDADPCGCQPEPRRCGDCDAPVGQCECN